MFNTSNLRPRAACILARKALHHICAVFTTGAALCASALLAAELFMPNPAQATPVAIVYDDLGGSIQSRLHMIGQFRSAGTRVEIRGRCVSACTMYLGLSNSCVAKSSRLGFHGPQSQYYGISLPPDEFDYWSQVMADHYPDAIRSWFLADVRETTLNVVTISGSKAIRMGARPCD